MELRVLQYFLVVAREENITRAAEILHMTQPTLSRQLMQLEEELNTKLFKRSNHSIRLTEEGLLLKRRAQEIVLLTEKTEKELRFQEEPIAGEIAIGSGETRNIHYFAEIIAKFRQEYPMFQYDLYTANADDIKERLDKGILDLGILTEPSDVSKYNFIRFEKRERWGVMVRRDSDFAKKDKVTPEELLTTPLFLVKRYLVKNELAGWFGDYFDQLQVVGTYNLLNNVAAMVEKGIGAAICLDFGNTYHNLCFVPLFPAVETGAVIVWNKNQIVSETTRKFIDFIKNYRMT